MRNAESFLTAAEREAVNRAVTDAEQRTSGEIVPVLATQSGRYERAEDLGGLLLAIGALVTCWFLFQRVTPLQGDWAHGQRLTLNLAWVVLIVVLGFLVGAFLTRHSGWLRRALATDKEMQQEVLRRAWEAFARFRVGRTQASTGILIYISLFERMVCVLGDDPIAQKLDQSTWNEVKDVILAGIRGKRAGSALCEAVARCGDLLALHFPIQPGDVNELPNELRILN
jgi:putative membrane protein